MKLALEIDDDVWAEITRSLVIAGMVDGLYGPRDEVLVLMAKAVREGKDSLRITRKPPSAPTRQKKRRAHAAGRGT